MCSSNCAYHDWLSSIQGDITCGIENPELHYTMAHVIRLGSTSSKSLRPVGTYRKKLKTLSHSTGVSRLLKFLRIAHALSKAPWANMTFKVNEAMFTRLTASHLGIIVGKDIAKQERATLLRILSVYEKLDSAENLIWITNRQQGKTSTCGKFLACLSICACVTGLLATVYSTSLDRAQELVKAAKTYLYWFLPNHKSVKFVRDTDRMYMLQTEFGTVEVAARPKNVDSCRGDAPHCALFDEIGFMQESFWYKFAFPLLQVSGRVFSCITTPSPKDGFFDVFCKQVQERNKKGDNFFTFVNHSLSCERCIELNEPSKCVHMLWLIPPWKSILRFAAMQRLIPKNKQQDFATEVFGVMSQDSAGYFPSEIVDETMKRRTDPGRKGLLWVGIDPASHGISDMSMVAFTVSDTGLHIVHGIAAVNVARCEVLQISSIVKQFLSRLRYRGFNKMVPIVETNGNEIVALSIVNAFGSNAIMPFTKERFKAYVAPGIGIMTTQNIKLAMIQQTYLALIDGRIAFSKDMCTADRSAFEGRVKPKDPNDVVDELGAQLKRFRDHPDGTVSGKGAAGENDDIAMALMMGIYWRVAVKASGSPLEE